MTDRNIPTLENPDDVQMSELLAMSHEELAVWALQRYETTRVLVGQIADKFGENPQLPWNDILPSHGVKKKPPFA
jgi:hypothetical protein